MKLINRPVMTVIALAAALWLTLPAMAASPPLAAPGITFDTFNGIYHLSRDSRGLSLLTSEETIIANFPGGGFSGIKRVLPKKYKNHSVSIKILNAEDAAGNPVPYRTNSDAVGNLVVTTGDPAITLSGSQTIKLRYQTSGVINLGQKADEFVLNVNGRGWDQPFNGVNATLYVPASFRASLKGSPNCYTVLNDSRANNCEIETRKLAEATTITSKAAFLTAHQALVLKLDFQPSTFTNQHSSQLKKAVFLGVGAVVIVAAAFSLLSYLRNARTSA